MLCHIQCIQELLGVLLKAKMWNLIDTHYLSEDGIENPLLSINICHHLASLVMSNGDAWGGFFLSHPHTYDIFL